MMPPGYDLKKHTLPQLLRMRAQVMPGAVAMRQKDYGIWNEVSYGEYYRKAMLFANGLLELGFAPGERLAVMADNIPEWLYSELGVQSVGGISVGVYQSSLAPEVAYVLSYTGCSIVVAEDQEQVDKLLEIRNEIPSVRRVIYEDPKGMKAYEDDPWIMSFAEVLRLGEAYQQKHPKAVDELIDKGKPEDVCHLSLTSGTTGRPKAAMLMHKNLIHMGVALQEMDPLKPTDDYLSFLPFAWIGEQMMSVGMALSGGFAVNFPESVDTAMTDLKEIGPHVVFSPPRVWEGIQSNIWVRISETYAFNRWMYKAMLKIGYQAAEYRMKGRPMPFGLNLSYWFADQVMFKPLRDQLGFLRLRRAYTGGAALGPDVFKFYHAIGVNLKQIYGQTEIIGIAFVHRDGDVRNDTVGVPIPGGEVRIAESGEILAKSDAVVAGYWERPEATLETFQDGWLHTGDAGYLTPEGHLVVIDRVSDVMHTSTNEMFSPQFIENKLKFSPYIKEAVVFGDQRPYLTAFINIDPQTAGKWAEDKGIGYTTYIDLSQKEEVGELIRKEIRGVNEGLPEHLKLKRFVLLYKLLDADDDELTRTGKVRRKFVQERYRPIVDGLYGGSSKVRVDTEFKYQDGAVQKVSVEVNVLEADSTKELVGA
jgi:long-chain acyl-CoA synthetase